MKWWGGSVFPLVTNQICFPLAIGSYPKPPARVMDSELSLLGNTPETDEYNEKPASKQAKNPASRSQRGILFGQAGSASSATEWLECGE